jgi:hypothetical protein
VSQRQLSIWEILQWYLPSNSQTRPFFAALSKKSKLPTLSKEDVDSMVRLMNRLYTVAEYAAQRDVKILVDAEHVGFLTF